MRPSNANAALIWGICMRTVTGASATPESSITLPALPTASPVPPEDARTCTNVWSTIETTVSRPQFYGPTLVTILASRTITTLEQSPTSYPCTLVDTIISRVTYEYRMTYSDGHSSTSISSAEYTIPTTTIQLSAPTPTLTCGGG